MKWGWNARTDIDRGGSLGFKIYLERDLHFRTEGNESSYSHQSQDPSTMGSVLSQHNGSNMVVASPLTHFCFPWFCPAQHLACC